MSNGVRVSVYLPRELEKEYKRLCDEEKRSMSWRAKELVLEWVKKKGVRFAE